MSATLGRWLVAGFALGLGLVGGGSVGFLAQGQPRPAVPQAEAQAPRLPAVRPLAPDTLLAWTPGGLPESFAASVGKLPGVNHVVAVVSGIVWLTRSFDPAGSVVDRPPAGLAIPLELAGANPAAYAPFLSPGDRALLPQISAGQAVLGTTSAAIRRLAAGGVLAFGPTRVRVAGVMADAAIGAHELLVSRARAARLGVTVPRYLLIDPAPGASRERLTGRMRRLLPPGVLLQVRGPGETPFFRQGDAVLPPVELKELFGEFAARTEGGFLHMDPEWVTRHIVTAAVPILGQVTCHRAIFPSLRGALAEIARNGLAQLLDRGDFGGCYAPRFINADPHSAGISHHTWGVAVDVNVSRNTFGATPHQDPRIVAIFERWGFTWGGRWILPDGMHFEFVRFATGG